MFVYNQTWKPPYSVMRTGSPVPTVPELYKIHSIMRALVYHICKIVLNSLSTYYHAYRKYTGSPRNKGISILQTHSGGLNNIHFRGVPC